MKLAAGVTEHEIFSLLEREAIETWGPDRLDDLGEALHTTAQAIWVVLQLPLDPVGSEPDFPPGMPDR